jgi:hypothetical protein
MIHATIDANGLLTLQADTQLEAFALGEWQRRKKMGRASLEIDTSVLHKPIIQPPRSTIKDEAIFAALSANGPFSMGDLKQHLEERGIPMAGVTLYGYLNRMKKQGRVANNNGLWFIHPNADESK